MKLFNEHISVFENFHSEPKPFTLGQWLKVCKNGSRYTEQVLEYRRTKDPELKKSLPLATVGAVCKDGRKLENIVTRTGWIALDIDAKDNPHLNDAEYLRDEVAKIANIAFSGLSAGGAGIWALVKVAKPGKQAEHFEELLKDFRRLGIVLDKSKGKNPNDARFYSYDPNAVIKDSFTIYKKLPSETVQTYLTQAVKISNDYSRYAEAAFKDELNTLSCTPPGNRNNQLFKSSASLAGLVAGGMLNEHEVKHALLETALSIGLKLNEINTTLGSGFDAGLQNPRSPDDNRSYKPIVNHVSVGDSTGERKYKSQNTAPYGLNPYTGEIFDKRGYPTDWDGVEVPKSGTPEHEEAEYYRILDTDPILKDIHNIFEPELITETRNGTNI